MKIDAPRITPTEKPNGLIVSWNARGGAYNLLISYTTPIACAFVKQGAETKWFKVPANHPKARSVTTMTHYKQFVQWMGYDPKAVKLDELPEAEFI